MEFATAHQPLSLLLHPHYASIIAVRTANPFTNLPLHCFFFIPLASCPSVLSKPQNKFSVLII